MAKAGKALKQTLETYGISQNRLAVSMGVNRSTINQWFNESRDPSAEAVIEIRNALQQINPDAAETFIQLFLDRSSATPDQEAIATKVKKPDQQPTEAEPLTPAKLRQRTGLTQLQLAILIGKTPSTIAKWESGRTLPMGKPSEIKRLCEAYQCTLEELIEAFEQEKG